MRKAGAGPTGAKPKAGTLSVSPRSCNMRYAYADITLRITCQRLRSICQINAIPIRPDSLPVPPPHGERALHTGNRLWPNRKITLQLVVHIITKEHYQRMARYSVIPSSLSSLSFFTDWTILQLVTFNPSFCLPSLMQLRPSS